LRRGTRSTDRCSLWRASLNALRTAVEQECLTCERLPVGERSELRDDLLNILHRLNGDAPLLTLTPHDLRSSRAARWSRTVAWRTSVTPRDES
jgi:hypothetical protein